MSKTAKNLSLQTIYQILNTILPLITAPYLARKLGSNQLGVFSFTTSIVAYFALVAMLGTVNYGTKCIASTKDNRLKRNEIFTSILSLQCLFSLIAIVGYAVYLLLFCDDNIDVAVIQGVTLISCLFDINWLFWGVEDFQITVSRSIVIKIITVALILFFVNNESDLWLYTLIMMAGTLISNMILFLYLPRYVSFTKVSWSQIKEHIKPNFVLFIPLLAMSVYHTMDKTMLGSLSDYDQSGFYYNSDKIVQMPLLVINGIGTVMLPRMSALITEKKQKEANELFVTTLDGVAAISIAIACGIAAISNEFIPFFFGPGYDACIYITIVLTPILLVKGFSVIVRTQYLIPMGMEREFTKSVVGGAIVNLILNFILIPVYGALGAAIATVIAESVACVLQFFSLRGKGLNLMPILRKTILYTTFGLIMVFMVRIASLIQATPILKLAIEIMVGILVYGTVCVLFWASSKNKFYEILFKPIISRLKKG